MKAFNKHCYNILTQAAELLASGQEEFACCAINFVENGSCIKRQSGVIDLFAKYFKPHKNADVWWIKAYCSELSYKQMDEARLLSVLLMAEMCKTEDFSV